MTTETVPEKRPTPTGRAWSLSRHVALSAALVVAAGLALGAPPTLAPAGLFLFCPLIVLGAALWKTPGLFAGAFLALGSCLLRLQEAAGHRPHQALLLETAVLAGCSWLTFYFHRHSESLLMVKRDSADDSGREAVDVAQRLDKEREQLEAARERARRLERIGALAVQMELKRDFLARLHLVAGELLEYLGGGEAVALLKGPQGLKSVLVRSYDGRDAYPDEAADFDQWVANRRMSLLVSDIEKDIRFNPKPLREKNLRSVASAPIVRDGQVLGLLRLCWDKVNAYSHDDLRLLSLLCEALAHSDPPPGPAFAEER